MEELRKTMENLSQYSLSLGQDLSPGLFQIRSGSANHMAVMFGIIAVKQTKCGVTVCKIREEASWYVMHRKEET
jgi:hypothetical protein